MGHSARIEQPKNSNRKYFFTNMHKTKKSDGTFFIVNLIVFHLVELNFKIIVYIFSLKNWKSKLSCSLLKSFDHFKNFQKYRLKYDKIKCVIRTEWHLVWFKSYLRWEIDVKQGFIGVILYIFSQTRNIFIVSMM